jgi:hypothetical protein
VIYFHLNQSFVSSENYAVPFFGVISLFSLLGEQIAEIINTYTPFHRLLRCGKTDRKERSYGMR